MQQARNLHNARKRDGGIPSGIGLTNIFYEVYKASGIRVWARPVAAAAVTPAPRVVSVNTGSKAPVAGSVSLL